MRRLAVLGVLLVLAPALACVRRPVPTNVHETHTFPAAPDKLVRLDLRSLDVKIKVAQTNTITAAVSLEARSSSRSSARRWIERNTPVFDDSPSKLEVRQSNHHGVIVIFGFMYNKGFIELTVPPTCRLEITTTSGDVEIRGDETVAGAVRVNTSSGDATVLGGVKELIVKTTSGDVRVKGGALAALQADTTSGDVTLQSGSDRTLVETSSGDVRLERLGGDLSADTSSGDVHAQWDRLPASQKVRVHTSSGDVRLRVPGDIAPDGEIRTTSGRIVSDFPGTNDRREHRLTFASGAGGVSFDIHTSSGDVTVRKGAQSQAPAPAEAEPHKENAGSSGDPR